MARLVYIMILIGLLAGMVAAARLMPTAASDTASRSPLLEPARSAWFTEVRSCAGPSAA